ncbi:hypothetical protein TWF718_008345 [Orbilia javanica]|uniref:DUF6594 domain-containing protein n=1 Tax=Orbilia javanica TaxID=47235 RepID=A0AAN8MMW2_9PEZI
MGSFQSRMPTPPTTATSPPTTNGNGDNADALDIEKGQKLVDIPLGYSYVAAFADGHQAAPVFRRFGALKVRVLLTQQAELEQKEARLARLDIREAEDATRIFETDNMTWLEDRNEERKKLIGQIAEQLRRYEEDLLLYRQMRYLPSAKKWQKENFRTMLRNREPICQEESEFIEKEDLISILKESDDVAELSEWVAELRRKVFQNLKLKKMFKKSNKSVYEGSDEIIVYSQKWMRIVGRAIFGALVALVMAAGVIVLYSVTVDIMRLVVLGLSTLVCAVLTAVFTTAKKSEVFAVVAAYCAVLVVFVGSTLEKNSQVVLQFGDSWINGTVSG